MSVCRCKRNIKKRERFGDWEEGELKILVSRSVDRLWDIEDILKKRGKGDKEEVLVKWKNWEGPNSWVSLKLNPELRRYITANRCNLYSSSLAKADYDHSDLAALKQAIFDALGEARYTGDGQRGRQRRVTVKLPFRAKEFEIFRTIPDVPDHGNVECYVCGTDLNEILGDGWDSRFHKTSTKTCVSKKEYIHLSWGYKDRMNFDHTYCSRCTWTGSEASRPELCNTSVKQVHGPPWLSFTFTRLRINMVTRDICKRKMDVLPASR